MRTSRRGIDSVPLSWGGVGFICLPLPDRVCHLSLSHSCSFTLWALLFVIARLLTLTLSVLTFSFGLPRIENQGFSLTDGNFNVLTVRSVRVRRELLLMAACRIFVVKPCPPQDDLPGGHLPDAGLDDVEIHQLPVEKVEGAQSEPGHKEESSQSKEQAPQAGSNEG